MRTNLIKTSHMFYLGLTVIISNCIPNRRLILNSRRCKSRRYNISEDATVNGSQYIIKTSRDLICKLHELKVQNVFILCSAKRVLSPGLNIRSSYVTSTSRFHQRDAFPNPAAKRYGGSADHAHAHHACIKYSLSLSVSLVI